MCLSAIIYAYVCNICQILMNVSTVTYFILPKHIGLAGKQLKYSQLRRYVEEQHKCLV